MTTALDEFVQPSTYCDRCSNTGHDDGPDDGLVRGWQRGIVRHPWIVGSKARLVALLLAAEASRTGFVTLRPQWLARNSDSDREYVLDIIDALEKLGLVMNTGERRNGRMVYRLTIPRVERVA